MKRKTRSPDINPISVEEETAKKTRVATPSGQMPSPRRRAFARLCKFEKGERIIGFYGGWPYIGSVMAIENIKMSFGSTYMLLIRWNGFSGKKATTWVSEFDVIKCDEAGLDKKAEMEEAQRQRIAEAGKPDKVKQKRIFLQVVQDFRGKKLAPFPSRFAPYAEEWQQIIRLTAMPKSLVDHLAHNEGLIHEKKLILTDTQAKSVRQTLEDWAGINDDKLSYMEICSELFSKFLFKALLYRFEIPSAVRVVYQETRHMSEVFPIEFGLRLMTLVPDLLTASSENLLVKGSDNETISSMIRFVNMHQDFLAYLEENIEPLLRAPARAVTQDDPLPESFGFDFFEREDLEPDCYQADGAEGQQTHVRKLKRTKRKNPYPVQKLPLATS